MQDRLGDFTISGVLGEGGSAVVYAAHGYGQDLALKVFHAEGPATDADRARFLAEAERMGSVSHPSLVQVLGAGALPDGRPFLAMPRLEGATLAARLTSALPAPRALALFRELALAVQALHDAGLVHRDIKPENVLWQIPGDRLVLLDLGIAREIDASPSTTTRAGFSRGTPAYMAPERLFGSLASVGSDVYELALVLVVMLLGQLPWSEGDPHARMLPDLASPNIPRALAPVLMRALSLDLARRPSSPRELLAWLDEASADGRASAPLATADTELLETPRPDGALALGGGAMTGVSTPMPREVFAMSTTPQAFSATAAAGAPREEGDADLVALKPKRARRSRPGLAIVAITLGLIALAGPGAVFFTAQGGVLAERSLGQLPTAALTRALRAEDDVVAPPPQRSSSSDAVESAPRPPSPSALPTVLASGHTTTSPSTPATATASAAPSAQPTSSPGNASAACAAYVALMCDPASGATAQECQSTKANTATWTSKYSGEIAKELCESATKASKVGLAGRKDWKPPP